MSTARGKLYVFEGPDGVGKTTIAKELYRHLNSSGIPCSFLAFPGRDLGSLGFHVYQLHHESERFGINSISPTSLQLLHIAAHIDALEHKILPLLASGINIILDRYWWSTWVYGTVSGISPIVLGYMIDIELEFWKGITPTRIFLIDRSAPLDDDKASARWHLLKEAYFDLADREGQSVPVFMIKNEDTIEDTLQRLIGILSKSELDITESAEYKEPGQFTQLNLELVNIKKSSIVNLAPIKPSEVYDIYWRFAAERQNIFFRKLARQSPPWSQDPILKKYRFTNAYRASDRVSQYLIRNVIYDSEYPPDDTFFRIILFKVFNKVDTWELLEQRLGNIRFSDYSFEKYDVILSEAMKKGETIFSSAYIMPSGKQSFGHSRKHQNYLRLLETMMSDEVPARITEMRSMQEVFELLRSYPMIGDFLAYQFTIDINYSGITNFSEMEFVVPGPGARDGIRKCFLDLGGLSEVDIIKMMADCQEVEFERLGINFRSLFGRPLQLIDCQNLFCEVDKYTRVSHPHVNGISGRKRIKQTYQPSNSAINIWYPPKWGLNSKIEGWISELDV
jgi:thymidylate kinase